MGVSDRDYMRRSADPKAVEDYERNSRESEYGSGNNRLRSLIRVMLVAVMVLAAVVLLVTLLAGS